MAIDPTPGSHTIYASYDQLGIERGSSTTPYPSFVEAMPCRLTSNNTDPACTDPTGFVAPFSLDPSNPQRIVAGTNRIWYSPTGGVPAGPSGWTAISADLTSGTRFNPKGDRLEVIGLSPTGVMGPILTGSRYGVLSRSGNSGAVPALMDWLAISGNLPAFPGFTSSAGPTFLAGPAGWISGIAINPANPQDVWGAHGGGDVGHVRDTMGRNAGP